MRKLEFLQEINPFKYLSSDVLKSVADSIRETSHSEGKIIYKQDETELGGIDVIVKGRYDVFFYDANGTRSFTEHYTPKSIYGGISVLLNKKESIRTVKAGKDTVVYTLNKNDFKSLCLTCDDFFQHFTAQFEEKMLNNEYAHFVKKEYAWEGNFFHSDKFYSQKVRTIAPNRIISCNAHDSVQQAARIMGKYQVSCLFIKDGEDIIGYVTDITLRDKIVATGITTTTAVKEVMGIPIFSVPEEIPIYEAIMLMFREKIKYLLITHSGEYTGVISRNKLLSDQAQSPFVFIQSVKLSQSIEELKKKWEKTHEFVLHLLNRGVKTEIINQLITNVSDVIFQKVVAIVIQQMGDPPAKFVYMILGSEGRKEQTLVTDQDNAIIYEDKIDKQREQVRKYFLEMSKKVSYHLDSIGFAYCKGNLMAKNPKWTHSLSHWKQNYETWINLSEPEDVMHTSAFFDCRMVYGEESIFNELQKYLCYKLDRPLSRFLHHMTDQALKYEPPLTFLNNIKTFSQNNQKVFNIKKVMMPIVDLVRMYALRHGIFKTNTGERLNALKEQGIFSQDEYRELFQSYYYLMNVRLRHQANKNPTYNLKPDNLLELKSLTKVEQGTLKGIFKVIKNFQTKIKVDFKGNLFE